MLFRSDLRDIVDRIYDTYEHPFATDIALDEDDGAAEEAYDRYQIGNVGVADDFAEQEAEADMRFVNFDRS